MSLANIEKGFATHGSFPFSVLNKIRTPEANLQGFLFYG